MNEHPGFEREPHVPKAQANGSAEPPSGTYARRTPDNEPPEDDWPWPGEEPAGFYDDGPEARTGEAEAPTPKAPTHPAEVVRRWAAEGPVVHAPTGFRTLDEACGGGLLVPRRVIFIGAPGSGKTAVVMTCGRRYAVDGHYYIGVHAIDEDDDDLTVRLAQMAGYTVAQCEGRAPELLEEIATALEALPVTFYDGAWTVEEATADVARRAQEAKAIPVYIVDSVQTVRSEGSLEAKSSREVVEANVRAIRYATTAHKLLTLATSEANRNSYRSEDAAEQTNDMAAGAESRVIEFSAQTLVMLRTPKGHADHVHATVPKNRRGRSQFEFYLRLERDRHELSECADPTADPEQVQHAQAQQRAKNRRGVEADAVALAAIVRAHPSIGELGLRSAVKLAGHKWGRDTLAAIKERLKQGVRGERLVNKGTANAAAYYLEAAPQGGVS